MCIDISMQNIDIILKRPEKMRAVDLDGEKIPDAGSATEEGFNNFFEKP